MAKLSNYLIALVLICSVNCVEVDHNGYIVYCPCMGRFGNQAEQFLGSLQFAKYLNRTLVLPPFIQYEGRQVNFLPFASIIQVEPLLEYHRVITLEKFMEELAPSIWPKEKRKIFCYGGRGSKESDDCSAFEGNPFKAFWNHLNISYFPKSEYYGPLQTIHNQASQWISVYGKEQVIALIGAPSAFPTNAEATKLQKYVRFSEELEKRGQAYRKAREFENRPFLAVHIRHGSDWTKACRLLQENDMSTLFASQQCLAARGINNVKSIPYALCLPSKKDVIDYVTGSLKAIDTKDIALYIATDADDDLFWTALSRNNPEVPILAPEATYLNGELAENEEHSDPILDVYLMSTADYFIGNCVSSFSAFASRYRVYGAGQEYSTRFFNEHLVNDPGHDEL